MTRQEMPLHIPDYRADTGHLSTLEHGAYLLLIMHYWMTGGLPDDDARLARITGMDPQQWSEAKPALLPLFVSGWKHKRVERELRKVQVSEIRSEAGKVGAEARWNPDFANGKNKTASLSLDTKKKKERGSRIANDWAPSDSDLDAARAEGFSNTEIEREKAKFRDYWLAKSGSAGVKLDWSATWRNWVRRAAEYAGKKRATQQPDQNATPNEFAIKLFRDGGRWNHHYGPEPGMPGCRASPELLAKYGYRSEAA